MKIYYAHSIKGNHIDGELTPFDIIPALQSLGHEILSEEFYTKQETNLSDKEIFLRDTAMIRECDIVLANVTNPSLGVGYELGYAESLHKPIICFYESRLINKVSAMVSGNSYQNTYAIQSLHEITDLLSIYSRKKTLRIVVTSHNPVKLQSTQISFAKMFPEYNCLYTTVAAPSGVADQPMSDSETLLGARNRVEFAQKEYPDADFRVGLEGGLEIDDRGQGRSFAWMVIASQHTITTSKTAILQLPPRVVELVQEGKELGEADDIVFGQFNSKQQMGAVGLLTDGLINRANFYEQALIFALVPHKKKELYAVS